MFERNGLTPEELTIKTVATEIKSIHVAFQTDLDRRPFSVAEII